MLQIELWKRIIIYGLVLAGLLFALPNAFYSRVESYNDANSAIENGQDPDLFRDEQQLWFDYLPSSLVNLGLDLRGGAHLLAEVRTTDVHELRACGQMFAMFSGKRDLILAQLDYKTVHLGY